MPGTVRERIEVRSNFTCNDTSAPLWSFRLNTENLFRRHGGKKKISTGLHSLLWIQVRARAWFSSCPSSDLYKRPVLLREEFWPRNGMTVHKRTRDNAFQRKEVLVIETFSGRNQYRVFHYKIKSIKFNFKIHETEEDMWKYRN